MSSIVKAGCALGVAVAIWSFIFGFAGWYKDPAMGWAFPVGAILIEIGALVWGLKMTAEEGRRYGGQIVAGLLICLVGAVIIFASSMIWSTVVFTDASDVAAANVADNFRDQGMTEDQVDQMLAATAFTRTPVFSALVGVVMTFVTGLIISLVTAAFFRQKE